MSLHQGDTPKNRAEKAHDAELAAYLENRQHYQMIQREDQETAVWNCWTLYEQDVDEETAVFLIFMRLTAAHLGLCDGRTDTQIPLLTCVLPWKHRVQTESEAVPKSDLNMYLLMIMAVIIMMETMMEMTFTLRVDAYVNEGEDTQ